MRWVMKRASRGTRNHGLRQRLIRWGISRPLVMKIMVEPFAKPPFYLNPLPKKMRLVKLSLSKMPMVTLGKKSMTLMGN